MGNVCSPFRISCRPWLGIGGWREGRIVEVEGSVLEFFPQSLTFTVDLGRVRLNEMRQGMVQV